VNSMKSAIFTAAAHTLEIRELPIPHPAPGQAVIRVERCGICGSDFAMTCGGAFDWPHGTAMGHEYAGAVVSLGAGHNNRLSLGDRVTALPMATCGRCEACVADRPLHCVSIRPMMGGFSEYALIEQRSAIRLPQALSFEDGALVEPISASLSGVRKLKYLAFTRIAVIGAGVMGAASVFWARQFGARAVVSVARSRSGEKLVTAMGADTLVTAGEGLIDRVSERLGGRPDIVIEAAGSKGVLQTATELVRPRGTVLALGGCSVPDHILPMMAMNKEILIQFSAAYSVGDFHTTVDTMDCGLLKPEAFVGDTIALSDLPASFDAHRRTSSSAKTLVNPAL
jgi:threonine dehydrogenase-like Zn-dependent dehydrogenase